MPQFSLIQMTVRVADTGTSRIADLGLGSGALSDVLYSTTRFDGQIDSWNIAGTTLTGLDSATFAIGPVAGNHPTLTFVNGQLLSGGGASGALTLRSLGSASNITGTASFDGPLVQPIWVTLSTGNTNLYAVLSDGSSVVPVIFDPASNVIDILAIKDKGHTAANQITAMATSTIAGVPLSLLQVPLIWGSVRGRFATRAI